MAGTGIAIYPELVYADVRAAMTFLTNAFGFIEHEVIADDDGTVFHAEMRLGEAIVMVESAGEDNEFGMATPAKLGGINQAICVYVPDLAAHYARAVAAGADIASELKPTNYGTESYIARDLDGHVWTFGTYRPRPVD